MTSQTPDTKYRISLKSYEFQDQYHQNIEYYLFKNVSWHWSNDIINTANQ